ncbi:hypothetical protein PMIN04_001396 [Paraphaeosphaeria minitans]
MARDRAARDSRYLYEENLDDQREREREREREERRYRRRHRHRDDFDYDYEDHKQRRERRKADEARRQAELVIDELRARRESYYSRPDTEPRHSQRMAQDIRVDREKDRPRSSKKDVRRDGTARRKKRRDTVEDVRDDEHVYGRPTSRAVVEEVTVRRSSAIPRRSDEGGSSSRTEHTPLSGSRSASLRKEEEPKLSRSMSARDPRVHMTRPSTRRTSSTKLPATTAAPPSRSQTVSTKDTRRSSGLLATFFRTPSRPQTAVLHKEVTRVECIICMDDDLPATKTAKLACGHRMCHSCLKRQFTLSVSDPKHMPPTCCNAEHIPLQKVERLFDDKFKRLWNKKYEEYTTANRLYCPTRGCGEWIKPSKTRMDLTYGRKYARCGRCSTRVCVLCSGKFHTRRECPRDEETNRLVEMAKEQGWQRCYNCRAVVELKEGCNHMTCRCTAQFCMVCAAPWKTCNCPWFNYAHLDDDDRLNDMRVPYHDVVVVEEEMPSQPDPVPLRRASTRSRRRPERERERERDLDRTDDIIAAHLQAQLRMDGAPTASELHRADPVVGVYGLGNSGGHHMNDSYAVRPLATAAARTATRSAAPRSFFSSRRVAREAPQEAPRPQIVHTAQTVRASAMAGLSRDGSKRGANRVGTWLSHVSVDEEAIHTAPRNVEVDDWRADGSVRGID